MKRLLLSLIAWLLIAAPLHAQIIPPTQSLNVQDSGTACANAGTCASYTIPNTSPAFTFQLTGTMTSLTVTFEATSDGQTWFAVLAVKAGTGAIASTTTSTGQYVITNTGFVGLRARCTTYASGGANVTLTRGAASSAVKLSPIFPASFTAGDLLYASGVNTIAGINDVAVNQVLASGGVGVVPAYTASPRITALGLGAAAGASGITFANATLLNDAAAGVLAIVSSGTTNGMRFPNGSNAEYGGCAWASNVWQCGPVTNGGSNRNMRLNGVSNANLILSNNGVDYWNVSGPKSGSFGAAGASNPVVITAPTDSTAVEIGDLNRLRSSSTITPATGGAGNCATAFAAAALTADCTIGTLKAGQKLVGVYADVTAGFTCSVTCSGTKVVQCGTAAAGTEILAAGLNVATTATYGLADADLGSGMTRAAAIQGGLLPSWSGTTIVSCRFTSGTGNWGTGAATNVNAGSIKFTLVTEQIK